MHYAVSGCPLAARAKAAVKAPPKDVDGASTSASLSKPPLGKRKKFRKCKQGNIKKKQLTAIRQSFPTAAAAARMGVVRGMGISSDTSEDSEANTSSDGDTPPARQLRSSRSDDSDKEKKPLKRKKLDLVSFPRDRMSSHEEKMASIPLAKRKKVELKIEEGLSDPTFTLPSSSSYFMSPMSMMQPETKKKKKRIPYTLVEASKGNKCPTEGCDGFGHITGMYAMHFAVSGCPLAHGKTAEECKARRNELNRLRSKSMQEEAEGDGEGAVEGGEEFVDRPLRRMQRSALGGLVGSEGGGDAHGMVPYSKKISSRVSCHPIFLSAFLNLVLSLHCLFFLYLIGNPCWPFPFPWAPPSSGCPHHSVAWAAG